MISNVRGQFQKVNGGVEFDEANPINTKVDVQIETTSVNTKGRKVATLSQKGKSNECICIR